MLGLATTRREWLTKEEQGVLNASYCGLCHSLRKAFGPWAAMFVNHEAQFLAILTAAQREKLPGLGHTRCPLSAFLTDVPILNDHEASEFAAAATMLLAGERLQDDLRDENRLWSRILLRILHTRIVRARQVLASMGFPCMCLNSSRRAQHLVEADGSTTLQASLEPTAFIVGEVFAHTATIADTPDNRLPLRNLGRAVGTIVVMADACQDLRSDRIKGAYNPIGICAKLPDDTFVPVEALAQICVIIVEQLHQIRLHLDELALPNFARLIENVLAGGIPLRVQHALSTLWKENHWTGNVPLQACIFPEQALCTTCKVPHRYQAGTMQSGDTRNCISAASQDLWVIASLLPKAASLAQELGFADEREYILACVLSVLAAKQEKPQPSGVARKLRLVESLLHSGREAFAFHCRL